MAHKNVENIIENKQKDNSIEKDSLKIANDKLSQVSGGNRAHKSLIDPETGEEVYGPYD